jgi:hypothetical protein
MRVAKGEVDIKRLLSGSAGISAIQVATERSAASTSLLPRAWIPRLYSKGWKETCVSVPIGGSWCVGISPQLTQPAHRKRSPPMTCSTGRLGIM